MSRRRVLAEVLAHMEAERFDAATPQPTRKGLPDITPAQAKRNRAILLAAISDDPHEVAWAESQVAPTAGEAA